MERSEARVEHSADGNGHVDGQGRNAPGLEGQGSDGPGVDVAGGELPEGLTRRDAEILALERQWWKYAGA